MNLAAKLQFERIADEFAGWRAVAEDERSPAPAWWWGPAFSVRGIQQPMPAECCASLELPDNASYADGAEIFLKLLAEQTSLPWPGNFPYKAGHAQPA
jgi:hypothetical protein